MTDAWRAQAACRYVDSEVFFPSGDGPLWLVAARQVCASCPVSPECLAYAVATRVPFGIWCGCTSAQIHWLWERHPDPRWLVLGPDEDLVELASGLPLNGWVYEPAPA